MGLPRQRNRPAAGGPYRGDWRPAKGKAGKRGRWVHKSDLGLPAYQDLDLRIHGVWVRISRSGRGYVFSVSKDPRFREWMYMDDDRKAALQEDPEGWKQEMQELEKRLIAKLRKIGRK